MGEESMDRSLESSTSTWRVCTLCVVEVGVRIMTWKPDVSCFVGHLGVTTAYPCFCFSCQLIVERAILHDVYPDWDCVTTS
jgi:hypothetical protein